MNKFDKMIGLQFFFTIKTEKKNSYHCQVLGTNDAMNDRRNWPWPSERCLVCLAGPLWYYIDIFKMFDIIIDIINLFESHQ